MKSTILIISTIISLLNVVVNDNVDAKKLFEDSKLKLSLKNIHLVLDLETSDGKGNSKTKTLAVYFAEFGEQKIVKIEFVAPENIAGTKIITTNYPNKKGIIEIYMPATGKIRKIRASQNNLKIMGSKIPINQFSTVLEAEVKYKLLEKEVLNGVECHKIKVQTPNGKGEYGIAFVSVKKGYLLRIEKYNMQNKLVGLTELSDYIKVDYSNLKVYPRGIRVKNLKTGESSNMRVFSVNYLGKVDIEDFKLSSTAALTN